MHSIPFGRKWLWLAIGIIVLLIGGLYLMQTSRPQAEIDNRLTLVHFTDKGVAVLIEVKAYPSGQMELLGTFTPTRAHFHLYSKDLPRNGLNGFGRPTLMEVINSEGISFLGALEADQPTMDLYYEKLGISFPVYPEGLVILSLPFTLEKNDEDVTMELSVTYLACSDNRCLAPVVDKRLDIKIPVDILK